MARSEAWLGEMGLHSFVASLGRSADRFSPSERRLARTKLFAVRGIFAPVFHSILPFAFPRNARVGSI
jgi:hypothetical protein